MATREQLVQQVQDARGALTAAETALQEWVALPANNVFATMEDAEGTLEDRLRDQAFADCEGAGNCGADTYTQGFVVDGAEYVATLTVEYNRYDKTYYYIEESDFSVAPVEARA